MQRRRWGGRVCLAERAVALWWLRGFVVPAFLLRVFLFPVFLFPVFSLPIFSLPIFSLPMDSAQNTKGASLEAAPLVPFGNFSLYIYFINLDGGKWTFCELYIRFAGKGMGGSGCFWGIDKIWDFRRIPGFWFGP
jgi:hypothetical protein